MAIAGLALACLFWGLSFPLMQIAMDGFVHAAGLEQRTGIEDLAMRATYNGWRFAAATLLYVLLTWRRQHGYRSADIVGGLWIGGFFTLGLLAQLAGLRYALPSISSILTSLVVVFVPLAQWWWLRKPFPAIMWLPVLGALVGVAVLSLPNAEATIATTLAAPAPIPWLGEAMTVVGALFFTGQVLAIDRYGREADGARLTLVMCATVAVLSLVIACALGGFRFYDHTTVVALIGDPRWLAATVANVVLGSVVGFHLMNVLQPRISATAAGVVYCLEPVFATACSVAMGTEAMTPVTLAGGGLVLLAVIMVARGGGQARSDRL
jgi:drug/metabolite transporter (DMT)-like permease